MVLTGLLSVPGRQSVAYQHGGRHCKIYLLLPPSASQGCTCAAPACGSKICEVSTEESVCMNGQWDGGPAALNLALYMAAGPLLVRRMLTN